ncbi:VOC family protein [Fulvivirga maritima]|uniref:VOC family protein n=1 Tax=Fulvivirga maritima TaxID=2904247 RepID=UPI001F440686|nr:VOC family protein [Fulvivirga maritima]UII27140.1 VOC family protein [Fulvivirga maritima]
MKLEHFAVNVKEPAAMAQWYVENMGLTIVKQVTESPYMTFMADDSGQIMIEIYSNPAAAVPDYKNQSPLIVHFAFVSEKPDEDSKRLQAAGAEEVSNDHFDDGSHIIMMRDPWGVPLQLCKRGVPMLK